MVKLTTDLVLSAAVYYNPLGDRVLSLRDNKIPAIENLGATKDQFAAIDLTNNSIRAITNFPVLTNITHLFLSYNLITRIDPKLSSWLPRLETLVLTHNKIEDVRELETLRLCEWLEFLCVRENPFTRLGHWKEWIIFRLPHLKQLDGEIVKEKSRLYSQSLFWDSKREAYTSEALKIAPFLRDGSDPLQSLASHISKEEKQPRVEKSKALMGLSKDETAKARELIMNAKSLAEIQMIETQLNQGRLPRGG